jgi:hypothetical protein
MRPNRVVSSSSIYIVRIVSDSLVSVWDGIQKYFKMTNIDWGTALCSQCFTLPARHQKHNPLGCNVIDTFRCINSPLVPKMMMRLCGDQKWYPQCEMNHHQYCGIGREKQKKIMSIKRMFSNAGYVIAAYTHTQCTHPCMGKPNRRFLWLWLKASIGWLKMLSHRVISTFFFNSLCYSPSIILTLCESIMMMMLALVTYFWWCSHLCWLCSTQWHGLWLIWVIMVGSFVTADL